ncbi:MAG: tetratricopeptide repeat protein [Planctomycetota bacterium]|nr:MAG: tetratricopeptide repeat protein [Planctomycetota bacterium]
MWRGTWGIIGAVVAASTLLIGAVALVGVLALRQPSTALPVQHDAAPNRSDDLIDRAVSAYRQDDRESLRRLVEADPPSDIPPEVLALARGLYGALENRVAEALDILHAAAQHPSVRPYALEIAGELLYQQGDFRSAEEAFKAAIIADPTMAEPHRWLAAWYYDVGAMDNALLHLDHLARLQPDDFRPWRMRGLILADFERHAEAAQAYRRALQCPLPPQVAAEIHAELAHSLLAIRDPEEALKHVEQAQPTADNLALHADCLLALGQTGAAQEKARRALELQPTHLRSLMLLAEMARQQGDLDQARRYLEKAAEYHPHEFDTRFHLMTVYSALGEEERAREQQQEMERLRELRTRFTELHHASMRDPSSADLRYELGQVAEQLGKLDLAIDWYRAALALDPSHSAAQEALGRFVTDPSSTSP